MKCKIFKNLSQQDLQTDYSVYRFSFVEYIRYIMEGVAILAVISYLFYERVMVFVILTPLLFWYMKIKKQLLCEKRKKELKLQFRDLCISISSSLSAGSSLTNAVISAYREMIEMYGEDSHISRELSLMIKSLKMNVPVESLFEKFAARADIEDIKTFSEILNIAQNGGGDMIKIMKTTADQIGDKVDIERDIQSIINAKKYEQTIMNIVPFIIIFYMKITSPETMAIMYKTGYGIIIMTICLVVYGAAYMLGRKITRIEV